MLVAIDVALVISVSVAVVVVVVAVHWYRRPFQHVEN